MNNPILNEIRAGLIEILDKAVFDLPKDPEKIKEKVANFLNDYVENGLLDKAEITKFEINPPRESVSIGIQIQEEYAAKAYLLKLDGAVSSEEE